MAENEDVIKYPQRVSINTPLHLLHHYLDSNLLEESSEKRKRFKKHFTCAGGLHSEDEQETKTVAPLLLEEIPLGGSCFHLKCYGGFAEMLIPLWRPKL